MEEVGKSSNNSESIFSSVTVNAYFWNFKSWANFKKNKSIRE